MDDLDVLLQDLEATIPDAITPEAKSPKQQTIESFDVGFQNSNANIDELDDLLNDLQALDTVSSVGKKTSTGSSFSDVRSSNDKLSSINSVEAPVGKTPTEKPVISTASQQLDDLMASLHDFHVNVNNTRESSVHSEVSDPAYAKPDKSKSISNNHEIKSEGNLDEMLQNMNRDLSEKGIRAASKGDCGACGKPVMGEVTTALGKVWHPWCFTCVVCEQEIGSKTFFEREGKPYCETCYQGLFAPQCCKCGENIIGQCVTAMNQTWHPECFICALCSCNFGDEGFHEFENKPYCRACYYNMFAPKCAGCGKPILLNYVSALGSKWHPECFVCRECMAPFTHGNFFELEGLPYCETHYHAKRGSLCAGCNKPITSRCISAMGKKFHEEHFVCAFCLKQLNKGTFKEQRGKPYCHHCYVKLFNKH